MGRCSSCRFWRNVKDGNVGACHRFPPSGHRIGWFKKRMFGLTASVTAFILTHESTWCGEYQPKDTR